MNTVVRKMRASRSNAKRLLSRFATAEDGMMTIFACFMIVIMLMVGGIGVDMMRHEMERTRIQAVSDRAVLAAADLDQTLDPEGVVRDYFTKSGMGDYVSSVNISEGLNYRSVTVDASTTINTFFMDAMGVETLHVPARSRAEEKVNKVEISMVLDISGSMNDNSKMSNMQTAAGEFIDTLINEDTSNLVSINLIPYSEHVNAGPSIFNRLNVDTTGADGKLTHNQSHCIEFDDVDFNSVVLNTSKLYRHMQAFQWNFTSIEAPGVYNTTYDTVCPREDYEQIVPLSQNAAFLKARINALQPRAGTQIFLGMKWATAMLDPSFRPINQQLVNAGQVDAEFAVRPVAYDDVETMKTIVLMTDGQNSSSRRIKDYYYRNESLRKHWENYNFQYFIWRYYGSDYDRFSYQKYTAEASDTLLSTICEAAKDENIVIYTIGFEVLDHGANVMRDCASSPSHFFRVEGVEISDAFDAIARQINQLRLTQ